MLENEAMKREIVIRVILSVIGILFVCFFSYSTSPLYPDYYGGDLGGDSAQFLTIGKAWMAGKVPYKEMFDHKGPLIFFIDMIGFMITGTKSGIMIIQSIFIIVTVNALFKLAKLYSDSNKFGVIAVIISLVIYKLNYVNGNSVEEYCLPFIAVSTYYQIKFLYNKSEEHSPLAAAFYGFSFGVCAMTRVTNGIMICAGVLVISIALLSNKKILNFSKNVLGFVLGFVVICFPFSVYFLWHRCFSDFIYDTFIFNIEYFSGLESWIKNADISSIATFCGIFFCYLCLAASVVFALFRKAKNITMYYVILLILETYLFMGGPLFAQYPAICMPQITLFLIEVYLFHFGKYIKVMVKSLASLVILILCSYSIFVQMASSLDIYKVYHDYEGVRGNYE